MARRRIPFSTVAVTGLGLFVAVAIGVTLLVSGVSLLAVWVPFYRGFLLCLQALGATRRLARSEISRLLRQRVDVLLLELGANDGLRGQDVDSMQANLQRIIDRTRAAYPEVEVVLAGMEIGRAHV